MDTQHHNPDHEVIARYTGQPSRLPAKLRRDIEASWHGAPVQLYALADLDHGHRLTEVWVALRARPVAVAERAPTRRAIPSLDRDRIEALREASIRCARSLTLLR